MAGQLRKYSGAELVNRIAAIRSAGVTYTREDLTWMTIEQRPGEWRWHGTDAWIGAAAKQGLHILAIPDAPPIWATGSATTAPSAGEPLQRYIGFVQALVGRYGTNGSFWAENPAIPKVPMLDYDIWNEPYMPTFWHAGFPDPAAYARMFKAVVAAVRPLEPQARFLLEAEVSSYDGYPGRPFLAAMFDAVPDLGRYADAISVHPYAGGATSARTCARSEGLAPAPADWVKTRYQVCRLEDMRAILDARGASNVPMWITEIGWSTAPGAKGTVTEAGQAENVHDVFGLLRTRWRGLVTGLVWHAYSTAELDPADREGYFGLVHPDGNPKPAWNAFVREVAGGVSLRGAR